jgi:hypothetical protein
MDSANSHIDDSPAAPWDAETKYRIEQALGAIDLPWSVEVFEKFLRQAIEGREYAKFVFSRNLSEALSELVRFTATKGMDRNELSHVGIQDLLALHNGFPVGEVGPWLSQRAQEGTLRHQATQAIELPPLLVRREDFLAFERPKSQPNFVTQERVVADSVNLGNHSNIKLDLTNKIVLIPQADPGYDWLFGHQIAALVTMYGGANSHMTIRAAEFGLPAAVGVGEILYEELSAASIIDLDCGANMIRMVR